MTQEKRAQIAVIIAEEFMNVYQYISKEILKDDSFELLKQIIEEDDKDKVERLFSVLYIATNNIINRAKELDEAIIPVTTIQ